MPGIFPERADITYFVTHPCHPPIFNDKSTEAGRKGPFRRNRGAAGDRKCADAGAGSVHFAVGEEVARTICAARSCARTAVTVEQMAILEPGLSETVCATLLAAMRDAMDEVVARGVPAGLRARLPARPYEHPRAR